MSAGFRLTWDIDAPPAEVFRAWTDPSELDWFFNDGMPRPPEPIEVDLRVGGQWRIMMVIDAGNRYFTGGVYREIVPNEKLVFTWGAVGGWPALSLDKLDECPLVTLTFRGVTGGTQLILDLELRGMEEQAARDGLGEAMRNGWRGTVDRLAKPLARAAR